MSGPRLLLSTLLVVVVVVVVTGWAGLLARKARREIKLVTGKARHRQLIIGSGLDIGFGQRG